MGQNQSAPGGGPPGGQEGKDKVLRAAATSAERDRRSGGCGEIQWTIPLSAPGCTQQQAGGPVQSCPRAARRLTLLSPSLSAAFCR